MRHNDANNMTPSPCHMRHSQNLNRIDSFLKLDLGIFILYNLIVGWGSGFLKKGLVFWIRPIDLGEMLIVRESSIHKSKNWYYLGAFQTYTPSFYKQTKI